MSIEGIDCSSTITNPAALKAAGKHFACRYLSTEGNPKNLHATEATAIHSVGLNVVSVFETTADRALGGHAAGVADAQSANAQARALGAPADVPIYFAVDFDMQPDEIALQSFQSSQVKAYFAGCVSVLGHDRIGGYGGLRLMHLLLDAKVCKYGWQTLAWSGGVWHPGAQLQQYQNGVTVAGLSADLDRAMVADYGQWHRPAPVKKWPKPNHYGIDYTDKLGKLQHIRTRRPGLWQARHPQARWHGKVTITPVFHPIRK